MVHRDVLAVVTEGRVILGDEELRDNISSLHVFSTNRLETLPNPENRIHRRYAYLNTVGKDLQ